MGKKSKRPTKSKKDKNTKIKKVKGDESKAL